MNDTATIKAPGRDPAYYGRIGHLGGTAVREKHGSPFFRKLGAKGGRATRASQDAGYYACIGRLGGQRRYERWLATKKAEAVL